MNETENTSKKKIMIGGFFLIVITVIIVALYFQNKVQITEEAVTSNENTTELRVTEVAQFSANGNMGLSMKGADKEVKKGEQFTLLVYADSKDEDILTYDAYIRYNNDNFQYEESKSLIDGVDILDTDNDIGAGYSDLIVTGAKGDKKGPLVFSNTGLVEITFTALKSGDYTMSLFFELGSTKDSSLYNLKNQDILGKVTDVQFTVK